jgi:hypothetical protein
VHQDFAGPSPAFRKGMRNLSRKKLERFPRANAVWGNVATDFFFLVILIVSAWTQGCGGGGSTSIVLPPPPGIVVTIKPSNNSVILGNSINFGATVTNTTNTAVTWSINGIAGGNATVGTISSAGVFTAPADLPSAATVNVTATSQADSTKSATVTATITSDVNLSIAPNTAGVALGATQSFQSSIASNGHPDSTVHWSIAGAACPLNCGTVTSSGIYTAPSILPTPAIVTVTAVSAADPSKQASASINVASDFTLQLAAPSSVAAGGSGSLVATLIPVAGSNPSQVLNWSISGSGCSGSSCGTLVVVTTQSEGGNVIASSATYTAPTSTPNLQSVTITVTPQADPSKAAQATIAIQVGAGVSLSPLTATLAANHRATLTAQINGVANTAATWSVNGVAGGNTTLGQICVVGSNPCQTVSGSNILQVDYLAPGAIPSPNPVSVQVTSVANPAKSASAQITILNHVLVSVLPGSVTMSPLSVQAFAASVLGSANQNVVWQVQGSGCSGGLCGSVDPNGVFTAPLTAPSPDAIQIVAVSSDDTTQSGQGIVTIATGANILTLHPASVYAGGADGFTLQVDGSGFAASTPGPGSTLLIGGTPRITTCATVLECTAPVTAVDVAIAGSVTVQIQNSNGTKSNAVSLVVVPPNASDQVISLTSVAPASQGNNIVVVEPTTAGVSTVSDNVDLNIAALGAFSVANNSCVLAGNPVPIQRPSAGTATADVCLFSLSGLDTSMTYTISGPGDVAVIAKQPAGLGIIHLTLQIPASAVPGSRTIFIQNTNLDKTAASGALEVD